MWEVVTHAGLLMIAMIGAFLLGILIASLIYRQRVRKSFVKKKKVTGFMPDIQDELWDIVVYACFSDLRFLAMLGYDPEIRNILEDPVLMDSKYLEESPLLPGEIALVLVNDKNAFLKKWQEKNVKFTDKILEMDVEDSMLFNKLNMDFNDTMNMQSEDDVLYFMYLRTPKSMWAIVLNMTFNRVIAVTPVLPELHSQILDISGDMVIRSKEELKKIKKLTFEQRSDL